MMHSNIGLSFRETVPFIIWLLYPSQKFTIIHKREKKDYTHSLHLFKKKVQKSVIFPIFIQSTSLLYIQMHA